MIWTGTYALPASAAPVGIVVAQHGRTATVSLGPGHSWSQDVPIGSSGARVRFTLPAGVVFDGIADGAKSSGTVRQGRLHGTFSLRRGVSRIVQMLGAYRSPHGEEAAVVEPLGVPPILVEFPSGAVHGMGASLTVGRRLGDKHGDGVLVPDATGFTWHGTHYARIAVRQLEVRVGVDAATVTLPSGAGPFAAVAMVHGSGPSTRDEFDVFTAYLALHGVAVIADDKRGVGESGGVYPGDVASASTLDRLALDAQAEVKFLATLPQVDRTQIGLWGDSQGGWIVPLAASREHIVSWAILNSGPVVTVGESDDFASLAGQSLSPPSGSRASMLAQVERDGPSGFDPAPALRALAIPVLWMYGADDRNQPTELSVERLARLKPGHDFSWNVLPTAHTPLVLPTGLLSSLPQSPGFDPRFFPDVLDWLDKHHIGS
jgi:hypothetical protein